MHSFSTLITVPPYLPDDAVTDITVKEGDSIILQCPVEATPCKSKDNVMYMLKFLFKGFLMVHPSSAFITSHTFSMISLS